MWFMHIRTHTHTHLKLYGPPSQGNLDGSSSRLLYPPLPCQSPFVSWNP